MLKKINEKCSNWANFPNMGRKRDELLPLLRSFAVDDYLIFYCAIAGGIEILRIASDYRNLDALFAQE
ncbi:type II toxin-antitoxin system RelE/ParE family toxin [Nostoc sp.]|uniref:type II toxin-antitoxin system RelE/ParE family toxin n=1 Tax=Nostoc sp. TaxID=1180 RepID=UPI002FF4F014